VETLRAEENNKDYIEGHEAGLASFKPSDTSPPAPPTGSDWFKIGFSDGYQKAQNDFLRSFEQSERPKKSIPLAQSTRRRYVPLPINRTILVIICFIYSGSGGNCCTVT
jgi:hypothetical protein